MRKRDYEKARYRRRELIEKACFGAISDQECRKLRRYQALLSPRLSRDEVVRASEIDWNIKRARKIAGYWQVHFPENCAFPKEIEGQC